MSRKYLSERPPVQDGQIIDLEIEDLTSVAEALAHVDGMATFTPGLLSGERARVKVGKVSKDFARTFPLRLLTASPSRLTPVCPVHLQPRRGMDFQESLHCGGCQLQIMDREEQLAFKRKLVQETLQRVSRLEVDVAPVVGGEPWHYRNKMAFSLTTAEGHLRWGLRSVEDGGTPVPLTSCEIAHGELWAGAEKIRMALDEEFGTALAWNGVNGCIRSATIRYHSGRQEPQRSPEDRASLDPCIIALFAVASFDVETPLRIVKCLASFPEVRVHFTYSDPRADAVYFDRAQYLNRPPGKDPSWGMANFPEEVCAWHTAGPWTTLVGPTSFLQVNDEMAAKLYGRVLDLPFEENGFAIDAYCGVGVLTRALAHRFEKVVGIELDIQSIKLARTTSRRLKDCRVEWIAEAAEAVFGRLGKQSPRELGRKPDLVVLDPPRKGCQQEVLRALLSLKPSDVVYISCHPAALARDLKTLCRDVFRIASVEPFDLFPQTHHVETLVHLKRR